MPVFVGPLPSPPPPDPPPRSEAREYTWFAPDGTVWPLNRRELGWWTTRGVAGLGAMPIELVTDEHPRGGARVRHVALGPRLITWPMVVRGDDHTEFLERWRPLGLAFTMTSDLGPGVLRIRRPDGTAREIEAWYQDGWDGDPDQGRRYDTVVLTLFCEDPAFRDVEALTVSRAHSGAGTSFFDPFPRVSPANVLGATQVVNPGDVKAWPQWTVTGPMTAFLAQNDTTGESFELTATLTAGQQATITTHPLTVRGPAGQNWINNLDWPGAQVWGLVRGPNNITFTVTGANTGTLVDLSFRPRYEMA